jgi:hypothetical protein
MKINELIFDMIVEEVKFNQKTKAFFNQLMTKWKTEIPELTDEQGEKVFNRYNNIKNQISIENSAIVRFLKRHDGRFPNKQKYSLNDLKQIQVFKFNDLVSFLVEFGKFDLSGEEKETNTEDEKAKLNAIFASDGNQPNEAKIEASKSMWFSDENCIINKGGVRVYKILGETNAKRMGYYYQSLHRQQYIKFRRSGKINSPWCVTWRGSDVRINDDEGKYLYGNGNNLYGSYRKNDKKTFYFLIDDNRNYLSDNANEAQYHMAAIQIDNNGSYTVTSSFNNGDESKNWNFIVSTWPQLDGERDKFEWRPLSQEELESAKIIDIINENPGDPNEFSAQTPQIMTEYITQGGFIKTVDSWNSMTPELKTTYITLMQLHDATSRISNEKLLKAILKTSPPEYPYREKLNRKLKHLGKNGIEYLITNYMDKDYHMDPPVTTSFDNKKIILINSKIRNEEKIHGLYDLGKGDWVIHDGITYEPPYYYDDVIPYQDDLDKDYMVLIYVKNIDGSIGDDTLYCVIPVNDENILNKGHFIGARKWKELSTKMHPKNDDDDSDMERFSDFNPETDTDIKEIY